VEEKMEPAMSDVWVAADAVVSPLGNTSEENFDNLIKQKSGVKIVEDPSISNLPLAAGMVDSFEKSAASSRLEAMGFQAIKQITDKYQLPPDRTLFILSTTKGNISGLQKNGKRIALHELGQWFATEAGLKKNTVISNACISGVMALRMAKHFLQSADYDHALVLGIDELSRFVVSGFQSLNALSNKRCKPFDAERKGINLGEAAAAMLLTKLPQQIGADPGIKILGSAITNDANHISGPSRTGEELALAIKQTLESSSVEPSQIDFISAHGTATSYNDEMEAKAFYLAGMHHTPLHSLKAFYGHTLGAAGVLETAMSIRSLMADTLIPSLGFSSSGVSKEVNIIRKPETKSLKTFLKTASGFGGCNAAIVFQKTV
jgi:3-oxoacyl-[acyl-carrier-protein] synthase I